jgi:periplasmic copper chaperone A
MAAACVCWDFIVFCAFFSRGAEVAVAAWSRLRCGSNNMHRSLSLLPALRLSRRDRLLLLLLAGMVCVGAAALGARDEASAPTVVEAARCDPTFAGAKVGSCTLVLRNPGRRADRLVAIETDAADRVEIHSMSVADGVMQMRRLPQGVEIAAGATVDFRERGYHLMLQDLKASLTAGATIDADLFFERAGALHVAFRVEDQQR